LTIWKFVPDEKGKPGGILGLRHKLYGGFTTNCGGAKRQSHKGWLRYRRDLDREYPSRFFYDPPFLPGGFFIEAPSNAGLGGILLNRNIMCSGGVA